MKKFALIAAVCVSLMVPTQAEAACGAGKGRVRNLLAKIVAVVKPGRAAACSSGAAAGGSCACANGTCTAK